MDGNFGNSSEATLTEVHEEDMTTSAETVLDSLENTTTFEVLIFALN